MKYCGRCKQTKNDDEFSEKSEWCRVCKTEYKRQWRIKNSEKEKEYYEKNREKIIERVKKYQKSEKGIKQQKEYYERTKHKRRVDPMRRKDRIIDAYKKFADENKC